MPGTLKSFVLRQPFHSRILVRARKRKGKDRVLVTNNDDLGLVVKVGAVGRRDRIPLFGICAASGDRKNGKCREQPKKFAPGRAVAALVEHVTHRTTIQYLAMPIPGR